VAFEAIDYNKRGLTRSEVQNLARAVRTSVRELIRPKGAQEAGLALEKLTEEESMEELLKNPNLLQRPIVLWGKRGVVARPVEKISTLLETSK